MERDHLGGTGIDVKRLLRWIFRKWVCVFMDWIDLTQDKGSWRALVNAVMNLRVL